MVKTEVIRSADPMWLQWAPLANIL